MQLYSLRIEKLYTLATTVKVRLHLNDVGTDRAKIF